MRTVSNSLEAKLVGELTHSIEAKQRVIEQEMPTLVRIVDLLTQALRQGRKVLVFGNGGSAADSQHLAAELVSRFRRERQALPALALTTDTSILTAIGNDYGFENVFSRQIQALGQEGDVAIAISTSGNSPNVLKAIATAQHAAMATVGLTGQDGGRLKDCVDICLRVPSQSTPHIQEAHIAVAHAICEVIEEELFPDSP
jgi:D-sedoheptulose 7-phosphate isomerase